MLTYKKLFFALFTFLIVLSLTGCRKKGTSIEAPKEDVAAKKMLQGIWISEDESPFFRVKGDTIYYPDTTSSPVYFYIHGDSLVMRGATLEKYLIVKQSPHLFVFKNHNGEQVRLELSTNADDINSFVMNRPVALNQNQLIKRDSVIMRGDTKYHYYIQVNPTTYKVVHSSLNDDGLQVDNVYYDNIVHISVGIIILIYCYHAGLLQSIIELLSHNLLHIHFVTIANNRCDIGPQCQRLQDFYCVSK